MVQHNHAGEFLCGWETHTQNSGKRVKEQARGRAVGSRDHRQSMQFLALR